MTAAASGAATGASPRQERRLYALTFLAAVLSAGHHLDHVVRGNHVGWPVTAEVTPFTYSLSVYPLILLGLVLYRSGRVGAGYWLFLSGPGALFLTAVHFGPAAIEPPSHIVDLHSPRTLGWLALAELLVLITVLLATFCVEARLWRAQRHSSA